MTFADAPKREQVELTIDAWHKPELPNKLQYLINTHTENNAAESARLVKKALSEIRSNRRKSQLEIMLIGWLYDFIRANVKRGRVFDLREVLTQGNADCVGYAKLFTLLGRLFGLDVGVVEVVIDNAGRYVPHTAVLVRLENGRLRFVDLWYGSKNIRHRRVGVQVKHGEAWRIEDVELKELSVLEEVCYLPDTCIDAITLYIRGNRHLNRREFALAIECYSKAICLYSGNARFRYNRAVAYENSGEHEKADTDYEQALANNAAIIRILAREHNEVISLLDLDTKNIDNLAQQMYLFHKGFTTGRKVPPAGVAGRFGLSEMETKAVLSSVETELALSA